MCVYERSPLDRGGLEVGKSNLLTRMRTALQLPNDIKQTGKWIVVCGVAYHISVFRNGWLISLDDNPLLCNKWWIDKSDALSVVMERAVFAEWNKMIGTPVFMIDSINSYDGVITINKNIPVLQDYGFASIIPAEQMYQNISMFITNELTEQMEMPTMTDKEKIASHGFDNKTSFRGKN